MCDIGFSSLEYKLVDGSTTSEDKRASTRYFGITPVRKALGWSAYRDGTGGYCLVPFSC